MDIMLTNEQVEYIVKNALHDDLQLTENEDLIQSLLHVIAWYSTPIELRDGGL